MEIIDDNGNLFGRVNVIDALAVLLVLAVVVAGIAVVGLLTDPAEEDTRYATIDLGTQPDYIVDELSAGDELEPTAIDDIDVLGADDNVTITDVYATPSAPEDGDETRLVVRAEIEGALIEDDIGDAHGFEFAGEPFRVGTNVGLAGVGYTVSGQVTQIDDEGDTLPIETTPVVLEATVPTSTASEIEAGDVYPHGPHSVATVQRVATHEIGDDQSRIELGVELQTIIRGGIPAFGGQSVSIGSTISIHTGDYNLDGTIIHRGSLDRPVESATRYVTLDLGTQPDSVIERLETGTILDIDGYDHTIAVTDVYITPTEPTAQAGDVSVLVRGEATGVERTDGDTTRFEFAGERLRVDRGLELHTDDYAVTASVERVDTEGESLARATEQVLIETTVSSSKAELIAVGDSYQYGEKTIATVAHVEGFTVGDDQHRLLIGLDLEALDRTSGPPTYGDSPLGLDATIGYQTDDYHLSGEVIQRGTFDPPGEATSRYLTLDMGERSSTVIERLDIGDELNVDGYDDFLSITDIHATPVQGTDDAHLVLRVEANGVERVINGDERFEFAGERLRLDDSLSVHTDELSLAGTVDRIDDAGESLELEQLDVLVETSISTTTANALSAGDEFTLGPHTVATIEDLTLYPTGVDTHRALVGLELSTIERDGVPRFGGDRVELESTIGFETDTYGFTGDVIGLEELSEPGDDTTLTIDLKLEMIPPERADRLQAGLEETVRGETIATVTDVDSQPAEVVLESEDGNIFLHDHPTHKDVVLEIEVSAKELDGKLRFHGATLHENDTLFFDFGTIIVEGDVIAIEE